MKLLKSTHRMLFILFLAFVCFWGRPVNSEAASATPGNVARLSVSSVGDKKATLKWTKASNASGYRIQVLSGTKWVNAKTITKASTTKVTLTKLSNGKTYQYRILAYKKVKGKTVFSSAPSNVVSATPRGKGPAAPVLKIYANNDGKVSLRWDRVKGVSGYEIFQKNPSGQFVRIGTNKSTASSVTVTIKNLTNGSTYQFAVRAFKKSGKSVSYSVMSNTVIGKPAQQPAALNSILNYLYTGRVKKAVSVTCSDGSSMSLKKGQLISVVSTSGSQYVCAIDKDYSRTFNVAKSNVTLASVLTDGTAYPSQDKAEAYVNYKGFGSPTPYLIWINIYSQRLYVFRGSQYNWKCINSFSVATGLLKTPTKTGMFRVYRKALTAFFEGGDEWYGRYCTWVQHGQAVHSWALHMTSEGEKLLDKPKERYGSPVSKGCVRANIKYAKWLYDTIPMNTQTFVY